MSNSSAYSDIEGRAFDIYEEGLSFTEEEAEATEQNLSKVPDQLEARLKLLRFYGRPENSNEKWTDHLTWLIVKHPTFWLTSSIERPDNLSHADIQRLLDAWEQVINTNRNNAQALGRAGQFISKFDLERAVELLTRAKELEQTNPVWSTSLFSILYNIVEKVGSESKFIDSAISTGETALELQQHPGERDGLLKRMTVFALNVGKLKHAEKYALQLLRLGTERQLGRTQFTANCFLGQIALRNEQLNLSEKYLLDASECEFVPDLTLANELLNRERRSAVAEFLVRCSSSTSIYSQQLIALSQRLNAGDLTPLTLNLDSRR